MNFNPTLVMNYRDHREKLTIEVSVLTQSKLASPQSFKVRKQNGNQ